MKLEMLFIGALTMGLCMVLGVSFLTSMNSNYNVDFDEDSAMGQIQLRASEVNTMQNSMKDKVTDTSVTDENAVDDMIKGAYTGTRSQPFEAVDLAVNATSTMLGESNLIDANIITFIGIVMGILVLFAIILLLLRLR